MNDTQTRIREFTDNDWFGLAGCECFAGGDEPLIAGDVLFECRGTYPIVNWPASFVADKNGIGFNAFEPLDYLMDENEEPGQAEYYLDIQFPTQLSARKFLEALLTETKTFTHDRLTELGFERE